MKKVIQTVATVLMIASFAFGITACNKNGVEKPQKELTQIEQVYAQYVVYAKAEDLTPLSYEEWLATIKGEKGDTGEQGEKGEKGDTGEQGETGRGIAKVEIIDGCLWVTYTDSETQVNVGALSEMQEQGTDGLAYHPLPDGTYAVSQGNTTYLEEIVIPATYKNHPVSMIANNAFEKSKITQIIIPDSVTTINDCAFKQCSNLTTIVIPNNVISIGKEVFNGCFKLIQIEIGQNLTSIDEDAFLYCHSLKNFEVSKDNIKYQSIEGNLCSKDGTVLVQPSIGKTQKTFTIPNGITTIEEFAFKDCYTLTNIVIPSSVQIIERFAFLRCGNLTNIIIPNSVTTIENCAFSGCGNLAKVVIPQSVVFVGYAVFYNCNNLNIFCKAETQPINWDLGWNEYNRPVVWAYRGE